MTLWDPGEFLQHPVTIRGSLPVCTFLLAVSPHSQILYTLLLMWSIPTGLHDSWEEVTMSSSLWDSKKNKTLILNWKTHLCVFRHRNGNLANIVCQFIEQRFHTHIQNIHWHQAYGKCSDFTTPRRDGAFQQPCHLEVGERMIMRSRSAAQWVWGWSGLCEILFQKEKSAREG